MLILSFSKCNFSIYSILQVFIFLSPTFVEPQPCFWCKAQEAWPFQAGPSTELERVAARSPKPQSEMTGKILDWKAGWARGGLSREHVGPGDQVVIWDTGLGFMWASKQNYDQSPGYPAKLEGMAMVCALHRLDQVGIWWSTQGSKHRQGCDEGGGPVVEAVSRGTCQVSTLQCNQPDAGGWDTGFESGRWVRRSISPPHTVGVPTQGLYPQPLGKLGLADRCFPFWKY